MLHFIKKLFSRKNNIIKELHNEHLFLYELYENMLKEANNKNIIFIKKHLDDFIKNLQNHLEKEDKLLYKVIEERFDKNNTNISIQNYIFKIKNDMKPIKRKLNKFLLKYNELNVDNIIDFIHDLNYIMDIIIKRIQLEENILYKYFEKFILKQ